MAKALALAIYLFLAFPVHAAEDETCLMQTKSVVKYGMESNPLDLGGVGRSESCTDLENQGAFFSVKIKVGTPVDGEEQQTFDVVADTGSDAVIVTSCVCIKQGYCPKKELCFQGTNLSSTFKVLEKPVNSSTNVKAPLGVQMVFGSGAVSSIIASDYVSVAGVRTKMHNGLLLMIDRRQLQVGGNFQGILGLGPPEKNMVINASVQKKPIASSGHTPTRRADIIAERRHHDHPTTDYKPVLFMQAAGVNRYTLCFNDGGSTGSFRLNVPDFKQILPAVGSFHWGLGLYGISVGTGKTGSSAGSAFFCTKDDMKPGMKTPCGVIPDSGTTLMMGPKIHIAKIFSELCDNWDRCKKARETNPDLKNSSKSDSFQKLLYNCSDWETDEGIKEVPSIFLDVGGDGDRQKLELTSWSYVVETKEELYKHHTKYLFGIIPVDVPEPTGKFRKVCYPSLGVTEYNTKDNGLVWILGHPLFYQFTVGYSLDQKAKNSKTRGAMAFLTQKCKHCSQDSSLLELEGPHQNKKRPREALYEEPRVPVFDTSLPL